MNESSLLIIGANGQLGKALKERYPSARIPTRDELDITNTESVNNFDWNSIQIVINAAAYTNVDAAESLEGRVAAWTTNAAAVGHICKAALEHELTVVHISTDYVFDGTQNPHIEDEPFSPLGVYGQSKAAGDLLVSLLPSYYILRASWVIGDGKNFVRTMLELGKKGGDLRIVADQIGRLTFAAELVRIIDYLLQTEAQFGTYNATNGGSPESWATIARTVFQEAKLETTVTDVTTQEYYTDKVGVAPRPLRSTLDLTKLHASGFVSRSWNEDLTDYLEKELLS
jgi:dTDP-4-dehydrorhamnose reductase